MHLTKHHKDKIISLTIKTVFWTLSILCAIPGIASLGAKSFTAFIIFTFISIYINPMTKNISIITKIKDIIKRNYIRAIILCILYITAIYFLGSTIENNEFHNEPVIQTENQKMIIKFHDNKKNILTDIKKQLELKNHNYVLTETTKYLNANIKNQQLVTYQQQANNIKREKILLKEISSNTLLPSELSKRYKELSKMHPNNSEYKIRAISWAMFSDWDGSHQKTIDLVKLSMHNPNSFEHVETRHLITDKNKNIVIIMQYRGTNLFGAIVTNYIKVKYSLNGTLLNILS